MLPLKLLLGLRRSRRLRKHSVETEVNAASLAEVEPLLFWAGKPARIWLPVRFLTSHGAFSYGGWHPLVAALTDGPEMLLAYYERFQPSTLAELYFLRPDSGEAGADLKPFELPWICGPERRPFPGEMQLGPEHGVSFYGPASPAKVRLEIRRLRSVSKSVSAQGYLPDIHGDISGNFLIREGDFRFYVRGGKHRAAVLSAMGWERIPVVMKNAWPRAIYRSGFAEWPLVSGGEISASLANAIFDTYFDRDGAQQRSALFP